MSEEISREQESCWKLIDQAQFELGHAATEVTRMMQQVASMRGVHRHMDRVCGNLEQENAKLIEIAKDRDQLLHALSGLTRDYPDGLGCWCEMAIGNPMCRGHSTACTAARAAVERNRAS